MGFRFRKSIKIAPGVRINVSKSGISSTVGKKGLSVNVGKRGVHVNAGIPGTGISYRAKVGGSGKKQTTSSGKKPSLFAWGVVFFSGLLSFLLSSFGLNILLVVILSVPLSIFFMVLFDKAKERATLERQAEPGPRSKPSEKWKKSLQDYEADIQKRDDAKKAALEFFEQIPWAETAKWKESLECDEDLVVVSSHDSQCPSCFAWEGKVLSLSGATQGYPTVATAIMDGLFHEGCQHYTTPYKQ